MAARQQRFSDKLLMRQEKQPRGLNSLESNQLVEMGFLHQFSKTTQLLRTVDPSSIAVSNSPWIVVKKIQK